MATFRDYADSSFLERLSAADLEEERAFMRGPTPPPAPKVVTPQLAQAADSWWGEFLTTTAADVTDVLTRGVTFGIIHGKHLPVLGDIVERYQTPEERKGAVRKVAEFGGELLAGAVVGGPLLNPLGRAAAAALLGKGAGTTARMAVQAGAEGTAIGAAQGTAGMVRGEDTLGTAALKTVGGGVLGAGFGAAVGKIESLIAARAARSANRVTKLQEEALATEAAALDEYEQSVIRYAKESFVETPPKAPRVATTAEATSPPDIPDTSKMDPRTLLKTADRLEASMEGMGQRGKAELNARITELRTQAMELQATDATLAAVADAEAAGLGKAVETAAEKWARRKNIVLTAKGGDPAGFAKTDFLGSIAGAAIGGMTGATMGDTPEERLRNALLGAGVGGVMSAVLLRRLTASMAQNMAKPGETVLPTTSPAPPRAPSIKVKIDTIGDPQAEPLVDAARRASQVDYKGKRITVPIDEIDSTDKLDEVSALIAKTFKEDVQRARRGTITAEERATNAQAALDNLAKEYDMPATYFLSRPSGTVLKQELGDAYVVLARQARQELFDLASIPKSAEVDAAILRRLSIYKAIQVKGFGFAAESGRSLNVWAQKPMGTIGDSGAAKLADLLNTEKGGLALKYGVTESQAADMFRAMVDKAQKGAKIEGLGQWTAAMQNGLMEAWINGLLSAPTTQAANIVGNTAALFLGPMERAVASRIGSGTNRAAVGEASEMLYALWDGMSDAWRLAAKSFRTGESAWSATMGKVETPRAKSITATAFGMNPEEFYGKGIDLLGTVVRTPGRVLSAADDFFKLLNFRMQQSALLFREASTIAGQTGQDARAVLAQLRADIPDTIMQQAKQFAEQQTFTNELGRMGQSIISVSNSNIFAKMLLPFVQTPINLAKYTLERTPLAVLMGQVRRDLASGGAARDLALAKMALGSAFMVAAAPMAYAGGLTGRGPEDPILRRRLQETGWQPYSLKIGDAYYSFSRVDPVGMALGMVGDYVELVGSTDDTTDDTTAGEMGLAVLASLSRNITSKTYVEGLSNAITAMMHPESKGFQTYFELQGRTIIPRLVATINRAEMDNTIREVDGFFDSIRSQIPGFSKDLPPKRDLYGNPIMLEGSLGPDVVSPIYQRAIKSDVVAQEISRNQVRVDGPPDWLGGARPAESPFRPERAAHGVHLNPQERDRWAVLMAEGSGGKSMKDALTALVTSSTYQNLTDGPDGTKAMAIQRVVSQYRDAAKYRLLDENPILRDRLSRKLEQRRAAHTTDLLSTLGR